MRKNKGSKNDMARMVQRWFRQSVTYEGEVYTIDQEQAEAVADESLNAIVVARAGSGKTRTIVAKIVYLIAKKGLDPDEIMAFVFNANAATEINKRLSRMMVDGRPVIEQVENDGESQDAGVMIARTFHAFSRKIVYEVCGGKEECGKILAGDKEQFVETVVRIMMHNDSWRQKITDFVKGGVALDDARLMDDAIMGDDEATDDGEMMEDERRLTSEDIARFANMMSQFINRAQQRYLGKEVTLGEDMARYLDQNDIGARERLFIELGVECYKRYHWYLLSKNKYGGLGSFKEFGTDFNLIVSWASKLIMAKRGETQKILAQEVYID